MEITFTTQDALTHKEAAHELGITTMTLWRWIKAGRLNAIRLGRYSVIPKSEIERLNNDKLSGKVTRSTVAEETA